MKLNVEVEPSSQFKVLLRVFILAEKILLWLTEKLIVGYFVVCGVVDQWHKIYKASCVNYRFCRCLFIEMLQIFQVLPFKLFTLLTFFGHNEDLSTLFSFYLSLKSTQLNSTPRQVQVTLSLSLSLSGFIKCHCLSCGGMKKFFMSTNSSIVFISLLFFLYFTHYFTFF